MKVLPFRFVYKNRHQEKKRLQWVRARNRLYAVMSVLRLNDSGTSGTKRANALLELVWKFPKDAPR